MPRPLRVLLLALVLAAPPVLAQSSEPAFFAVRSVTTEGQRVVVEVVSPGRPMMLEIASLTRNGSYLAPQLAFHAWVYLEPIRLAFDLAEPVPTAVLTLVHSDPDSNRREESHVLHLPAPPTEDDRRAVQPWDATRDAEGRASFLLRSVGSLSVPLLRATLQEPGGAFAGAPFVREVRDLPAGGEAWVEFDLVWEGNPYVLVLQYANRTETTRLHLREADEAEAGLARDLALHTDFPSRDAEPGTQASFSLRLENRGGESLVTLRATGVPAGFTASFLVQGSRASSFRVAEGATRDVTLQVTVPSGARDLVGDALPLRVEALVDGEVAASAALALAITGTGRLEVTGENWFVDAAPGQAPRVEVVLTNPGTAPVFDVALLATVPSGWGVAFDPPRVARLDPGDAQRVGLTLTPPPDVGPGRYHVDVSAASGDVDARPRVLTVGVPPPSSSALPWVAAAGAAGLLALGLVVKLRRK